VTAPPPPRLIPKSLLGISIWVSVLLDKYLFYRPTYRLLEDLRSHGLDLGCCEANLACFRRSCQNCYAPAAANS